MGTSVRLSQSPLAGISRSIEIHLAQERAEVTLNPSAYIMKVKKLCRSHPGP